MPREGGRVLFRSSRLGTGSVGAVGLPKLGSRAAPVAAGHSVMLGASEFRDAGAGRVAVDFTSTLARM